MVNNVQDFKATTFEGEPAFKVTLNQPLDFSTPNKKSEFMKMLGLEKAIHPNLNLLNAQGHLICYQDTLEGITIKWLDIQLEIDTFPIDFHIIRYICLMCIGFHMIRYICFMCSA